MSDNLMRMLEINSKVESKQHTPRTTVSETQAYQQPTQAQAYVSTYDPNKEMDRLMGNGGASDVDLSAFSGRKIPQSILESIIGNPIDIKPPTDVRMDNLTERIANSDNVNKIKQVMDRVVGVTESVEHVRPSKPATHVQESGIDYELIKLMIESAIDKKLDNVKQTLNEGRSYDNAPAVTTLSFKDKFYFVDDDDNVFECVMKYRGKKKRKS